MVPYRTVPYTIHVPYHTKTVIFSQVQLGDILISQWHYGMVEEAKNLDIFGLYISNFVGWKWRSGGGNVSNIVNIKT